MLDLTPYLPRVLVDWQRERPHARWLAIPGTLVFVDISGFTALSERLARRGKEGAEEITEILDTNFARLLESAYGLGGSLLKFGGDALLLLFTGDGHARRACAAAARMRRKLREHSRLQTSAGRATLRMSAGLHSGTVHLFLAGDDHRELLITGPVATGTVAMESQAQAGEVQISDTTATMVPGRCLGDPREGGFLLAAAPPAGERPAFNEVGEFVDAGRFIPAFVRDHLLAGQDDSEHRRSTVAFLRFSTDNATLDDERIDDAARGLDDLMTVVQRAAFAYGVCVLASDIDRDGGKIILTAGVPLTRGDDEERMLRALRDIVSTPAGRALKIGVHSGHVFAGSVGPPYRRTYTVMGDTVNLAARLMQRAEAGQIIASAATATASRAAFAMSRLDPFFVKGKSRAIEAFSVGALREPAIAPSRTLPFVGRDAALRKLSTLIEHASAGRATVVEITGETGLGKTRLIEELRARHPDVSWLQTAASPYDTSTPYFAFRALLRRALNIDASASSEEAGAALAEALSRRAGSLTRWLPLVADVVGADVASTPEVDALEAAFRRPRLHDAVGALLAASLPGPAVYVIEDAQWLDEASLDLLSGLAASRRDQPWLTCILKREADRPPRLVDAAVLMELGPLDGDAVQHLVRFLNDAAPLPATLAGQIAARSGGNPLFLREMMAAQASVGGIDALPESIEAVIAARIDALSPADKLLLRHASVLGNSFDAGDLGDDTPSNEGAWRRLDDFLLGEGDGRMRFRHALVRDVAYEHLPYRRRRELHLAAARRIERRSAGDGADREESLSLHCFRGGDHARAWQYSRLAGERARAKFANIDAAEFYKRAITAGEHAGIGSRDLASVCESVGDVYELSALYDEAGAAYAKARRLSHDGATRLLRKQGVLCERKGAYTAALRWYGRGLALAERASGVASPDRIQLELAYAGVRFRQGRYADCVRWCRRVVPQAKRAGERKSLAHAYYLMAHASSFLGEHDSARWHHLALPIFEELGDIVGQANVLNNLGIEAYFAGRWQESLQLYGRSHEARERAGDVVGSATAANNIGEILSDQGRLDEAQPLFEDARRVWRGARYPVGVALATSNLGRLAARAGRSEEALRQLAIALAGFKEIGAGPFVLETEARICEAHVLRGDDAAALEHVGDALSHLGAGSDALRAMLLRLQGTALARRRGAGAAAAFAESERLARQAHVDYELALTLQACAHVDPRGAVDKRAEAEAIFDRLGVVQAARATALQSA